jgi:uncharacterized membrane protein YjjB (DUF3815 family)
MNKWNSRKLAALLVTLVTNLLVWGRVESEMAEAFATAAINALALGYLIVQGWIDAKERDHGRAE